MSLPVTEQDLGNRDLPDTGKHYFYLPKPLGRKFRAPIPEGELQLSALCAGWRVLPFKGPDSITVALIKSGLAWQGWAMYTQITHQVFQIT